MATADEVNDNSNQEYARLVESRLVAQREMAPKLASAIESCSEVRLYSLDPGYYSKLSRLFWRLKGGKELDQYRIIGSVLLKKPEEIRSLAESLRHAIESSDGTVAMCFNPRHALRFKASGREVSIVVCFECLNGVIAGFPGLEIFYNTREPASIWNQILDAHKTSFERNSTRHSPEPTPGAVH